MAIAKKTNTKKVTRSKTTPKRAHFAIRAIRNANPKGFRVTRTHKLISRIFSF